MNKYRYLFKNIGLLTLSQFATKLIAFFLVPLYTSILSTTEYGTFDIFNTTIAVLIPILTLNIQEAILRFALDKKVNRDAIATVGFRFFVLSNFIVALGLMANILLGISEVLKEYSLFIFCMYFVQALSGIIIAYARGSEHIADLAISSVIASVATIACNILFLIGFKWGFIGYFLANIIGPFFQSFYLVICTRFLSHVKKDNFGIESEEMSSYSKPLIANSIAWWVNNVSDRYVVVFFCGLAENGIYSVAGKIPSILNIFQSMFNSAWTLSAVKDFDPEDKDGFFSNTYKAYNCLMVVLCSGIIFLDKVLAQTLYAKEFYVAWKYVPWLTISIVFGALSGYLGGFFSAVKDSKIFATSTIVGAVTNLILNLLFTPMYGAMGAAVATTICYFVVWVFRYRQSKKYIMININVKRDLFAYLLLVVQSVVIDCLDGYKMYIIIGLIFLVICLLYIKDIFLVFSKILKGKAV